MYRIVVMTLICVALCSSLCEAKEKEFFVTKVIDGSTVVLENGDTVHYLGISTPRLKKGEGGPQFYAREALKQNKTMVLGKKVRLEFDVDRKDAEGRLLAYVYVKTLFVNAELVRLGCARADIHPPDIKHKDLLLDYQKEAAGRYAGLWQEAKRETEPYYVGNKRSHVFHRPSCPLSDRVPEKSRIIFRSRADAIGIGYAPCAKCKP
jgi:micrococcal nuclease